eukprot:TRINITY_DN3715_c0_g3_i2.p1 TRINITY_DN3715_c0_g3~~TRINITY_DN3715_c0_g3_i2.p1  ORF type:complete len:399 (+),score=98.27 TRINITY_DN3715_c0_g3_i2:91-1287(+)
MRIGGLLAFAAAAACAGGSGTGDRAATAGERDEALRDRVARAEQARGRVGKTDVRKLILLTCETSHKYWADTAPLRALHSSLHAPINLCDGIKWENFRTKINAVKRFALRTAQQSPNDVIMFFDSRDTLINDLSREEVLDRFDRIRGSAGIVIGCEHTCYQSGFKGCTQRQYDLINNGTGETAAPDGVATRYLNSGVYLGSARALADFLVDICDGRKGMNKGKAARLLLGCDPLNDQCHFANYALENPKGIVLDYRQELIANFGLRLPKKSINWRGTPTVDEQKKAIRHLCWQNHYRWSCHKHVQACCTTPRVDPSLFLDYTKPCRVVRPATNVVSRPEWGGAWSSIKPVGLGTEGLAKGHSAAPLIWHASGLPSGAKYPWKSLVRRVQDDACRRQRR